MVALTVTPDMKVNLADGVGSLTNNALVGLNANLDKDLQIVSKVCVSCVMRCAACIAADVCASAVVTVLVSWQLLACCVSAV